MKLPPTKVLPIDDVVPYWRNPRRIPAEAVEAVRVSLSKYGYQQPIVVDKDNVVVVGHTRLAALKELGTEKVPVYVFEGTAAQAQEYRLVDNRTGEMSDWDFGSLVMELREVEEDLLAQFFPDVNLEIDTVSGVIDDVTADDVAAAQKKVMQVKDPGPVLTTKVECPACYHTFEVRTDSLPGISRLDLEVLATGVTDDGNVA